MSLLLGQESIDKNGIFFILDAKNPRSYPGTGTTWYDISGNGYNFSMVNSPSWDSDGWFVFNGVNQYFSYLGSIPNHTELTVITQLEYADNVTFDGIVMSRNSTENDYQSGNWVVNQTNTAGAWGIETNGLSSNSRISDVLFGRPMSVASCVLQGGNVNYYLNGELNNAGDLTYTNAAPNWESHNQMFIGNRNNGNPFQGKISYVLVAHKAWSTDKIKSFTNNLHKRFI